MQLLPAWGRGGGGTFDMPGTILLPMPGMVALDGTITQWRLPEKDKAWQTAQLIRHVGK